MILSRIEITNYKQYGGHHEIDIPQVGAIGVIGANGVGKTTLFEAIEWALYSPSTIKSTDVKPRVWRGKTEVKVTLDDPANGGRYLVERELGKGSAKARIYRVDKLGFEEKIVDGATQVTTYVTDHLIGLDHAAFVATFFTRQKELGFFNGSPTTRRREVGKLLGLETIREAQQLIAEDRKRAQADARSYQAQSEAQMRDRDFAAETSMAEESIEKAKQGLALAVEAVTAASAASARAQSSLAEIEKVREQDIALAESIQETNRKHDVAKEQVAGATRDLARIESLSAERVKLEPVAATRNNLEAEANEHDALRQKSLRKRELEQLLTSLQRRDEETTSTIKDEFSAAPAPDGNKQWNSLTPVEAADWAARIELTALENQAQSLSMAVDANEKLQSESATLNSYLKRIEDLHKIEASLLESGDPQTKIQEIQTRLQELNGSRAAAKNTATRLQSELQKTERMIANLRAQHEGEICPTCQRPFSSEETAHAISVFDADLRSKQDQLRQIGEHDSEVQREIAVAESELKQIGEIATRLTETRASIQSGNRYLQEQQSKVDQTTSQLQSVLTSLGRDAAPTVQERDAFHRELLAWRKVVEAGSKISRALRIRAQIAEEREPLRRELQQLGDVQYNEVRHREVTELLQRARQAQVTIERIDTDLSKREQLENARRVASATVEQATKELNQLQGERSALGFDASKHQAAQQSIRSAQEHERSAVENRHRADVAVRESENRLASIKADQERIGKLALEAEARQREADDLDLMYKEFTEFERFAAAWYAPRLSEIASDLVAQVTDGKYDRVEFDSNFSIQVYDGDDEKFPYETFSGGERDAIALCARIALSRVIGGASASPPGFLVLDEVFGSLDLERRQRLLEMLAAITGADDHFRQVFIISHVDDVRTSPILDDIWRVTETEDGTSELQTLGVGVDIGEL